MRRFNRGLLVLATAGVLGACGDEPREAPAADETALADESTVMPRTASPDGAAVFFVTPADGDIVSSPVVIEFGITGMAVAKAGEQQQDSGHHHLIIDTGLPDLDAPIPADKHYLHFGDASTSTELTLEPGQHTLQLLLGDHAHVPHEPPVLSDPIKITVE